MTGCQQLLSEGFKNLLPIRKEKFNVDSYEYNLMTYLFEILSFVIVIILVSLLGAFLWNNSVLKLFKVSNKANWQTILYFYIFINLML